MEGGNSKSKTNSKSTSSKKTRSVKKVVDISNEQLLEEILNKKKAKKNTSKNVTKKDNTTNVKVKNNSVKRTNKLKDASNDLLYEQIKLKKNKKKSFTKSIFEAELEYELEEAKLREKVKDNKKEEVELSTESKIKINIENDNDYKIEIEDKTDLTIGDLENTENDSETIENNVIEQSTAIKKEADLDVEKDNYNSLEQSVIRKKEQKDDFVEFLTEIENDKLLKEIKAALANNNVEYVKPGYEQSKEDALKKIDNEINERIKSNAKNLNTNRKKYHLNKKILMVIICICLFIFLIVVTAVSIKLFNINSELVLEEDFEARNIAAEKIEREMLAKYNECLERPLDENDISDSINQYITNINLYFNDTYKISVMYTDLNFGYTYSYNVDKTYYAASTIKSLGAIYLYEKASLGEVNLDEEIVYLKKHRLGASAFMKEISYGTKVSLRNLVKYSITASDNTAHKMIVDYIGVNTLVEYGKSLGATLTHLGGDLFGYINVNDATIYMKKLNQLINDTGDLGQELKSYFINDDQNGLEINDMEISAAHKYGQYEGIYHDIGIVYAENPYIITILTEHGKLDFVNIIKDINSKIFELHNLYYNNRVTYCEKLIYSN